MSKHEEERAEPPFTITQRESWLDEARTALEDLRNRQRAFVTEWGCSHRISTSQTGSLRKAQAPSHYKALEQAGVLRSAERTALTTINRTRNGVAHIYGDVTADEVHQAIEEFEALLSGDLPERIKNWLLPLGL